MGNEHHSNDPAYNPCTECSMTTKTISRTDGATLIKCASCQHTLDVLNLNLSYLMKTDPTIF